MEKMPDGKWALTYKTLLLATFSLWFGGFTFYVTFVVPIGTEILGSARSQGFITQQVTHRLNAVCAIAVLAMTVEAIRRWRHCQFGSRATHVVLISLMAGMLIGLVALHPMLDALVDLDNRKILGRTQFYGLHRIYLWLSTFQWVVGWIWLLFTIRQWQFESGAVAAAPISMKVNRATTSL